MARPANPHPTDGEMELLQILWQSGPTSLGQICSSLRSQRTVATTTVATMLKVMLEKKLVVRKAGKQGYLWSAKTTRKSAAMGMVQKLVDLVFDGSAERLVAHLVESGQISDQERKEIQKIMQDNSK
jgi:BlaI family transcriptional regulator, penicillinase repressor